MQDNFSQNSEPLIIVIDDDLDFVKSLGLLLSILKFKVASYPSGEAFKAAVTEDPALLSSVGMILLDVRMMQFSGIDVFYWVNQHYPHSCKPIVFLTGHGELNQAVEMIKMGAYDFLVKPFSSEHLLTVIKNAISRSKILFSEDSQLRNYLEKLSLLTPKEVSVMEEIINGETNKAIAEKLSNSVRTIELHRASIFHKLEIKDAYELYKLSQFMESRKIQKNQ